MSFFLNRFPPSIENFITSVYFKRKYLVLLNCSLYLIPWVPWSDCINIIIDSSRLSVLMILKFFGTVKKLQTVGFRKSHSLSRSIDMTSMKIKILPALQDNYMYLVSEFLIYNINRAISNRTLKFVANR